MTIAAMQLRALRLRSSYIEISNIVRGRSVAARYGSPVRPRYFSARACLREETKLPAFLEAYKKAGM
jgi:aspartyl-tRNA synthetase